MPIVQTCFDAFKMIDHYFSSGEKHIQEKKNYFAWKDWEFLTFQINMHVTFYLSSSMIFGYGPR